MSSSQLTEELASLQDRIESISRQRTAIEGELRSVEAELARLSADRGRFDAVRDACKALDRVWEAKAEDLFWEGSAEPAQAAGYVERARNRVAQFEREMAAVLEKQASVRKQLEFCDNDLYVLDDEVREAYAREARRDEEYVIVREMSAVPNRPATMPWSTDGESEKHFRKNVLVALLAALFFSVVIPLLRVPKPVRPAVVVIPERLVSMLREEPRKAAPPREEKKPEKEPEKKEPEKKEEKTTQETRPEPATEEARVARKKAESSGVLAFKESFKGLVDDTPSSRVGAQARLSSPSVVSVPADEARPGRSLVTLPSTFAKAGSGGIGNTGITRTVGRESDSQISTVEVAKVQSTVATPAEQARPVSSGPGPSRTDEEIQLVFDKYKATLYRMYNAELRRNPTLRGKLVLRITIEPGGEVSACQVQSNELDSQELVAQIVERVKRFNFGPKERVPSTSIVYPIVFLPGV